MKTIKAILVAILIFIGISATAQHNPFTFGVKGGINLSNMTGDIDNNKAKVGFNLGLTLDYTITENWYALTDLEYTTKGVKGKKAKDVKTSINAAYLQLPIHIGYKLAVSDAAKVLFHAGPYFAYGTNGNFEAKYKGLKGSFSTFDLFDRFDLGIGLGVGSELGKINIGIGYDFGLLDIAGNKSVNVGDETVGFIDATIRNANAYLTLDYKF